MSNPISLTLAAMPPILPAGSLTFCGCGHTPDEHLRHGQCLHVNPTNAKKQLVEELCVCEAFAVDARLPDGEDFARRVLQKVIAKEAVPLERVDLEDVLQVMFMQLWRASAKYDSRSHIRFRVYAYYELFNDAIDEIRRAFGRHGQHRVYDPRSGGSDAVADGDSAGRRQGEPASRDPGDDHEHWLADVGGLLAGGDREEAGHVGADGGPAGERDDARARGRSGRTDRRARAPVTGKDRGAPRRALWLDCAGCGWRNYLEGPNGLPGWHEPDVCGSCGAALRRSGVAA